MECDNPNKGSFAWKSLLQARHVLDLGTIWRVGNGESIVIRGDKWLPKISASKVISPAYALQLESRVCDLIDHEKHTWKKELISQEFLSPYKLPRTSKFGFLQLMMTSQLGQPTSS